MEGSGWVRLFFEILSEVGRFFVILVGQVESVQRCKRWAFILKVQDDSHHFSALTRIRLHTASQALTVKYVLYQIRLI